MVTPRGLMQAQVQKGRGQRTGMKEDHRVLVVRKVLHDGVEQRAVRSQRPV